MPAAGAARPGAVYRAVRGKLLNTLRRARTAGLVLYWSDDYTEAVSVMQPVMDRAARLLPAKSPELIEIQLRYANILAGVYRIDEAEGHFRAVIREYQTTTEPLPNRARASLTPRATRRPTRAPVAGRDAPTCCAGTRSFTPARRQTT